MYLHKLILKNIAKFELIIVCLLQYFVIKIYYIRISLSRLAGVDVYYLDTPRSQILAACLKTCIYKVNCSARNKRGLFIGIVKEAVIQDPVA